MGLKRFDYKLPNKSSKKQITALAVICLIAVLAFSSYALYKMTDKKDVVDSKVGEFYTSKVKVKVLVDDTLQDNLPKKGDGKILDSVVCTNGVTGTFDKTNWKLNVDDETKTTECTVKFVTGEDYNPYCTGTDTSSANAPVLDNGLIPVVYHEKYKVWIKADTTKCWKKYSEQMWANAVTVKESERETYQNAQAGSEIVMDDINAMWVWVPRYEYDTTNLTKVTASNSIQKKYAGGTQEQPGAIPINFISKSKTTTSSSNYVIHPAFTFGTEALSGIWVAKFELSTGDTVCTAKNGSVEKDCDITTILPESKPNKTSWRGARLGTFWMTVHDQMNGSAGTATYGISNSDTHILRNMEWAAVAYLSQSKYGKYGNTSYTGTEKEVAINNCSTYITGIGGDTVSAAASTESCTANTYETAKGKAASTTGNIYGIYDMSGGASEYVMGNLKNSTNSIDEPLVGYNATYNSGFSGSIMGSPNYVGTYGYLKDIDRKYYEQYNFGGTYDDIKAYYRGIVGDATKETVGWYQDGADFIQATCPWFTRGGYYGSGTGTGVFAFSMYYGAATTSMTSRVAIVSAS